LKAGTAGSVKVTAPNGLTVNGNLVIYGGYGGDGGDYWKDTTSGGDGGDGGKGGGASLSVSGTATISGSGMLLVQSGKKGAAGGFQNWPNSYNTATGTPGTGGGGDASFTADTLVASQIIMAKNDGELTFTVGTLDVTGADSALVLNCTDATKVRITTANLANNRLLSVNNADGDATISLMRVAAGQRGRLFVAVGAKQTITNLTATDAGLTFVLPSNFNPGAGLPVVTVNTANLTGAQIGIDTNGANLVAGNSFALVDAPH
jgi:hypothetical protein